MQVGDRVIQIDGTSIERSTHDDVIYRLRKCDKEVSLLVIDRKSAKHYKTIAKFRSQVSVLLNANAGSTYV